MRGWLRQPTSGKAREFHGTQAAVISGRANVASLMPVYARSPFALERGEGVYVYDTDNNEYLDFAAGIGVSSLGHGHPHLTRALN
jgi:acetylornithine/succinyldiaminopimelate/putrescine aminotransferase